jgi:hypothetical protein
MDQVPNATIDIVLVGHHHGSLFNAVSSLDIRRAQQEPGIQPISSLQSIPQQILELVERRLRICRPIIPVPESTYRQRLKAANELGEEPDNGRGR